MHRTYTFQLKPTRKQAAALNTLLAQLCELYNMALEQRRDAWKTCRKSLGFYDQCAELTRLRAAFPGYSETCVVIQRDPLKRLDLAFKSFFRRARGGEKAGYPRFKSRDRYDSFSVGKNGMGINGNFIKISKLGTFRAKTHFKVKGDPLVLRVVRNGKKWVAKLVCDIGPAPDKFPVKNAVGIDLGLTSLLTLSDGSEIENPRWTKQFEDKLAGANQALSRKQRGSKNRAKARESLRRLHQRIAGNRSAYLHSISQWLVSNFGLIAYEDLKIRNMAKSNLAKSIMDASWNQLIQQITYKAEEAGRYTVAVDPRNTTQNCSQCGEKVPKELKDRWHSCPNCGLSLSRDHNAALNIFDRGMRSAGLLPQETSR